MGVKWSEVVSIIWPDLHISEKCRIWSLFAHLVTRLYVRDRVQCAFLVPSGTKYQSCSFIVTDKQTDIQPSGYKNCTLVLR